MFERIKLNLWFISNQSTTTRQQPKQSYLILSWLLCFPPPAAAKSVFPFPLEFKISEKAHDELLSCCSPTEPLVATEAPSRHLNLLLPIKSSSVAVSFLWKIISLHLISTIWALVRENLIYSSLIFCWFKNYFKIHPFLSLYFLKKKWGLFYDWYWGVVPFLVFL